MRTTSEYKFECVGCGQRITSQSPEVTCPACGAAIRLEWRGETKNGDEKR